MTNDAETFHVESLLKALQNDERVFTRLGFAHTLSAGQMHGGLLAPSSGVPARWTLQRNFFKIYGKALGWNLGNILKL